MKNELGVRDLLSTLGDVDLFSLFTTVTSGLLKNKPDRNEAISIIVQYSGDELSLFKRKVFTKDILFSYLHAHQVPVKLPVTKNELVTKILDYWGSAQLCQTTDTPVNQSDSKNDVTTMANEFAKWFYMQLNNSEDITEHFYSDCYCRINWQENGDMNITEIVNNVSEFNGHLRQLRQQQNLVFNPNLSSEGCQGRIDPHGLVIILICGTLHILTDCVGVFEQVFSLARDPFADNNWKIKKTEVNLKKKQVHCCPCLTESELTNNVLLSFPD